MSINCMAILKRGKSCRLSISLPRTRLTLLAPFSILGISYFFQGRLIEFLRREKNVTKALRSRKRNGNSQVLSVRASVQLDFSLGDVLPFSFLSLSLSPGILILLLRRQHLLRLRKKIRKKERSELPIPKG